MAFWPFGRDPDEIEMVSRVVTATTLDHVKLRGKLTVHFVSAQSQTDADHAADRCAELMEKVLHEQANHENALGSEASLVLKLLDRLPPDIAKARSIELAALHVVGGTGSSSHSSRPRNPGSAHPPPPSSTHHHHQHQHAPPSSTAPRSLTPQPSHPPAPAPRRRSSSRMRAITSSLVLPAGSSPHAIGSAIAAVVSESAARLSIGFLRIHDLINVRGVTLEEGSDDLLQTLTTLLEPPHGETATAREAEFLRWKQALGAPIMDALKHEASVVSTYRMTSALLTAGVPQATVFELMEECCGKAFSGQRSPLFDIGPYSSAGDDELPSMLALRLMRIVGSKRPAASMIPVLMPLLASIDEDTSVTTTLVKYSLGLQ